MSAADIEARRAEAVRKLRDIGHEHDADCVAADPLRMFDVTMAIDTTGAHIDEDDTAPPGYAAALHALALLLAAMTEPT